MPLSHGRFPHTTNRGGARNKLTLLRHYIALRQAASRLISMKPARS
jgi:hypothetical protein